MQGKRKKAKPRGKDTGFQEKKKRPDDRMAEEQGRGKPYSRDAKLCTDYKLHRKSILPLAGAERMRLQYSESLGRGREDILWNENV